MYQQLIFSSVWEIAFDETLYYKDVWGQFKEATPEMTLDAAAHYLESCVNKNPSYSSPSEIKALLRQKLGTLSVEIFGVIWLDTQNRVIKIEEIFRGTINQTSVYPREVVKGALAQNASSVVLFHNHPSGQGTPSRADEQLTQTLKAALALIDVRVLDHLIVTAVTITSMAESGLI